MRGIRRTVQNFTCVGSEVPCAFDSVTETDTKLPGLWPCRVNGCTTLNCPPYCIDAALLNHVFPLSLIGTVTWIGAELDEVENWNVPCVTSRVVVTPMMCNSKPPEV